MKSFLQSDIDSLLRAARRIAKQQRKEIGFGTGISEAEAFLRDLDKFPHHFVLACVMDRQIRANRAWAIPYLVGVEMGGFKFANYENLTLVSAKRIFRNGKLHRFNNDQAQYFVAAVKRIRRDYNGNAYQIWRGTPSAAAVIRRFLEFDGVGVKIATMATNLLLRQFGIPMRDKGAIDISPDVQVRKFFVDRRLLREDAKDAEIIYLARELSPRFPGLLDALAWEGGRMIGRKAPGRSANL